jgi:hypothetical protein
MRRVTKTLAGCVAAAAVAITMGVGTASATISAGPSPDGGLPGCCPK